MSSPATELRPTEVFYNAVERVEGEGLMLRIEHSGRQWRMKIMAEDEGAGHGVYERTIRGISAYAESSCGFIRVPLRTLGPHLCHFQSHVGYNDNSLIYHN